MRIFLLLVITGLFFYSCNTNPPTSPEKSYPVGKVIATTTINLNQSSTTANKIVLLEDFANVSCVPCVVSNQVIESLLNGSYAGKIAVVKFPISWPSPYDPFYLANKTICDDRIAYYNVSNAPTIMVDGLLSPQQPQDSNDVKAKIEQRLTHAAQFGITVDKTFQDSSLIVNINVTAVGLAGINLNDLVLKTIVIENDIEFEEAPGANGERVFYNVLRTVLPANEGYSFAGKSALQQPIVLNWDTDLLSNWNPANLHVVAFIQNNQTKEVLQTGSDY
jgi:hypothetical protein